jgi:hypothetical protein
MTSGAELAGTMPDMSLVPLVTDDRSGDRGAF